jgi:hypothetical protein
VRTPDWDEVREFLTHDGWHLDRSSSTDHDYFEKTLATGETLVTRVSRAGRKTMSPGRFRAILADQLRVSEAQFWETIRTGGPAERPSPEPIEPPPSVPLWLVRQLASVGVEQAELEGIDESAARRLLEELRSRPRG